MDCRTFKKRLEDYLEGGLDFPGRFGMERHAQQCFSCGKIVADAQELSRMARESRRVAAPSDFETAVMRRIQTEKTRRGLRQWVFRPPSLRWMAAAASAVAVVGIGVFLALRSGPERQGAPAALKSERALPSTMPAGKPPAAEPSLQNSVASVPIRTPGAVDGEFPFREMDSADSDFIDCLVPGPDNRMRIVRLPKTIRMRYQQPSKMYFIRNVSH